MAKIPHVHHGNSGPNSTQNNEYEPSNKYAPVGAEKRGGFTVPDPDPHAPFAWHTAHTSRWRWADSVAGPTPPGRCAPSAGTPPGSPSGEARGRSETDSLVVCSTTSW